MKEPASILAKMTYGQFKDLLFSSSSLVNTFVRWLYDESVHDKEGEWYLMNNHQRFVDELNGLVTGQKFDGFKYNVVSGDTLIQDNGKFSSIKNLVNSSTTAPD